MITLEIFKSQTLKEIDFIHTYLLSFNDTY